MLSLINYFCCVLFVFAYMQVHVCGCICVFMCVLCSKGSSLICQTCILPLRPPPPIQPNSGEVYFLIYLVLKYEVLIQMPSLLEKPHWKSKQNFLYLDLTPNCITLCRHLENLFCVHVIIKVNCQYCKIVNQGINFSFPYF